MKKVILLLLIALVSVPAIAQLSQGERDFAVKYLNATHNNIVETVKNLPDEAFNYKPENGGWSVANALEHILLTENTFYGMAQQTVANPENKTDADLSQKDGVIIGMLANRGTKVKTAAPFEPTGKWDSKQAMIDELEKSRNMLTKYLNSTDDKLRKHKASLPFGEVDMYQLMLIIAAHSQRHTAQMQEVLAEYNAM